MAASRSTPATITSSWSPRTPALAVYLYDENDKPVDAKGAKATGIFVIDGKSQRIELKPEGANKLSGTSPVALPATLKGAVQITLAERQERAGQILINSPQSRSEP